MAKDKFASLKKIRDTDGSFTDREILDLVRINLGDVRVNEGYEFRPPLNSAKASQVRVVNDMAHGDFNIVSLIYWLRFPFSQFMIGVLTILTLHLFS